MKTCTRCLSEKSLSNFYKLPNGSHKSICKDCERIYAQEKRDEKRKATNKAANRFCVICTPPTIWNGTEVVPNPNPLTDNDFKNPRSKVCNNCKESQNTQEDHPSDTKPVNWVKDCYDHNDLPEHLKKYLNETLRPTTYQDIAGGPVKANDHTIYRKVSGRLNKQQYLNKLDETYLERFGKKLTDRFNFDWSRYSGSFDKWLVECREHNTHFLTHTHTLLKGSGCPFCDRQAQLQHKINLRAVLDYARSHNTTIEDLAEGAGMDCHNCRSKTTINAILEHYEIDTNRDVITYQYLIAKVASKTPYKVLVSTTTDPEHTVTLARKVALIIDGRYELISVEQLIERFGLLSGEGM